MPAPNCPVASKRTAKPLLLSCLRGRRNSLPHLGSSSSQMRRCRHTSLLLGHSSRSSLPVSCCRLSNSPATCGMPPWKSWKQVAPRQIGQSSILALSKRGVSCRTCSMCICGLRRTLLRRPPDSLVCSSLRARPQPQIALGHGTLSRRLQKLSHIHVTGTTPSTLSFTALPHLHTALPLDAMSLAMKTSTSAKAAFTVRAPAVMRPAMRMVARASEKEVSKLSLPPRQLSSCSRAQAFPTSIPLDPTGLPCAYLSRPPTACQLISPTLFLPFAGCSG
jgi:hypothetical protein